MSKAEYENIIQDKAASSELPITTSNKNREQPRTTSAKSSNKETASSAVDNLSKSMKKVNILVPVVQHHTLKGITYLITYIGIRAIHVQNEF